MAFLIWTLNKNYWQLFGTITILQISKKSGLHFLQSPEGKAKPVKSGIKKELNKLFRNDRINPKRNEAILFLDLGRKKNLRLFCRDREKLFLQIKVFSFKFFLLPPLSTHFKNQFYFSYLQKSLECGKNKNKRVKHSDKSEKLHKERSS